MIQTYSMYLGLLTWIVYPKKIIGIIYSHPHIIHNPYNFHSYAQHK